MLLIGIDEAGYGPLLGPLTVAGSAFRLDEGVPPESLAERIDSALEATHDPSCPALRVGDSKQIFGGPGRLGALERPVLAFLASAGRSASTLDHLLRAVLPRPEERLALPWYAGEPARFPVHGDWDSLRQRGEALCRHLVSGGVEFLGFAADAIPEDRLNRSFVETGNKADTLFDAAAAVLDRLLAHRIGSEPVRVVFDRQGGRKHYLAPLNRGWPGSFAWTLEEGSRRSSYQLGLPAGAVRVDFLVGADGEAPQVALGSMLAKYLREVFMALWNQWFREVCPGVPPTAGYTEDGRRWLAASRGAREAAGVPDEVLVRTR